MKNIAQIFFIHGGMTFRRHKDYLNFLKNREISIKKKIRWFDQYIEKALGSGFEIIRPRMPLQENAKYSEWKINFERYFPELRNGIILVGGSLGGIFLAKYLSENRFPKKILSVYLVCPPFDNTLSTEDLAGGFRLKSDLSLIEQNCRNVNLLFSKNDNVVPVEHAKKYAAKLQKANIVIYDHIKGHFKISEFPEIVKMIKRDARNRRNKN